MPNYANRQAYMTLAARQVRDQAESIAWLVVADGTTTVGSTDQQVVDRVLALWNVLAG